MRLVLALGRCSEGAGYQGQGCRYDHLSHGFLVVAGGRRELPNNCERTKRHASLPRKWKVDRDSPKPGPSNRLRPKVSIVTAGAVSTPGSRWAAAPPHRDHKRSSEKIGPICEMTDGTPSLTG